MAAGIDLTRRALARHNSSKANVGSLQVTAGRIEGKGEDSCKLAHKGKGGSENFVLVGGRVNKRVVDADELVFSVRRDL